MQKQFPMIFGGVIASILLLLYTVTLAYMIVEVMNCAGEVDCGTKDFAEGMIFVVTTVGGLVSALVVSELTITKPGENPGIMKFAAGRSGPPNRMATALAIVYLAVWLIIGLAALIVGTMIYPGINETVSDIGTTWLGLAVAAGYAYFRIDPSL